MSLPPVAGRRLIVAYAVGVYAFFLGVLGYTVGFLAGFGVPKDIDQGPRVTWPAAVAVDVALLLLFAVQHTVMARPWFKRRWVPAPAERATFVLCANLALVLLSWLWRPLRGIVWRVPSPAPACSSRCTRQAGGGHQCHVHDQPRQPGRPARSAPRPGPGVPPLPVRGPRAGA